MKKIISIEGMHCAHCAMTVEKAVSAIEGVSSAKVNLDKKNCTVSVKGEVSDEALTKAVKDAGFDPQGVETKKSLF